MYPGDMLLKNFNMLTEIYNFFFVGSNQFSLVLDFLDSCLLSERYQPQ